MDYLERERQQEFINKMVGNGYELFEPTDEQSLYANFKKQLEDINEKELTDKEFEIICAQLGPANPYNRRQVLFNGIDIDRTDGTRTVIKFINKEKWCQNNFQIAQEVVNTKKGKGGLKSRFDAVIFINGLPLVIFEFKQPGVGCNAAVNQLIKYATMNHLSGLFGFTQLLIGSSFTETKYFANNLKPSEKFTFNWTDESNNIIGHLYEGENPLVDNLLGRCFIAEMIVRFMIQDKQNNVVLRPYQVHAIKKILRKVDDNDGGGYIFHTTGSGKTITSFTTCSLLTNYKNVDKVLFLVDRKDLDAQTKENYDSFAKDSYDKADNSRELKKALFSNNSKIVVGTVQKMTNVINRLLTDEERAELLDRRFVVLIDECHRSQADANTSSLRRIFDPQKNAQFFGFTGTPIFDENAKEGAEIYRTTEHVFGKELHRYSITNAIRDENVLAFNVFYYQAAQLVNHEYNKDLFLNQERIDVITKWLGEKYSAHTNNRRFNSIFATNSQEHMRMYYYAIKAYNDSCEYEDSKIKFTCIFSVNENDEDFVNQDNPFFREVLADFNEQFNMNIDDVEVFKKKVYEFTRDKKLDLVLVVNMMLTGFDSPVTNTLYVDKKMRYHTLLQSYSRVNRLSEEKNFGNIITFLDQSEDRDNALKLFSAGGSYTDFEILPYEELVEELNKTLASSVELYKEPNTIVETMEKGDRNLLTMQLGKVKFILKHHKYIKSHPDYDEQDLNISKRELGELKDKYRFVSEKMKTNPPKDDDTEIPKQLEFDFELELLDDTIINHKFLIELLETIKLKVDTEGVEAANEYVNEQGLQKHKKEILYEVSMRSKDNDENMVDIYAEVNQLQKEEKLKQYCFDKGIDDVMKFLDIAYEQEVGNLPFSENGRYLEAHKPDGFKARIDFKKETFDYVEDVINKYSI